MSVCHWPEHMQCLCVTDLIACNVCVLLTWSHAISACYWPEHMQCVCVTDLIACNICVLLTWSHAMSVCYWPDRMQCLCVTDLIACNVCVLLTWIRRSRTKLFFEVKCCGRVDVFLYQHLVKSLAQRLARLSSAPFLEHGQRLLGWRKVDARRWKTVQECLSSLVHTFQEVHGQRSNVSNVAEMAGQIRQYGRSLAQVSTGRTLTCMNKISKLGHCVSQLKDKISSHTEHGSEAEDGGDGGGGGAISFRMLILSCSISVLKEMKPKVIIENWLITMQFTSFCSPNVAILCVWVFVCLNMPKHVRMRVLVWAVACYMACVVLLTNHDWLGQVQH